MSSFSHLYFNFHSIKSKNYRKKAIFRGQKRNEYKYSQINTIKKAR